jgi:MFS family permease
LYSGLVLATAVSGLLAAGIFEGMGGVGGLEGWRWLFILEGAATAVLGLIAFVLLPDFPATKSQMWLFTPEEKEVAVIRMARDAVSDQESDESIMYGLKLAVTDIKVWVFVGLSITQTKSFSESSNTENRLLCSALTSPLMGSIISSLPSSKASIWVLGRSRLSVQLHHTCLALLSPISSPGTATKGRSEAGTSVFQWLLQLSASL